jgi:hypothetical protein
MIRVLFTLIILLSIVSCGGKQVDHLRDQNDSTATANSTERQAMSDRKPLFNGKDLSGWRFFKNKENNSWEVKDGLLHCKPFDAAEKRSDLMTIDQFKNFELSFEWKLAPQSNSGVLYMVTERSDQPYFTGPEYQLLDEAAPGERKNEQLTGACYDMYAPKTPTPQAEWNTSTIIVNGDHVEHWLSGTQQVVYDIGSDDWLNRKNLSKWKDVTGYAAERSGHIVLQDHGGEVWLRNIMIKQLP